MNVGPIAMGLDWLEGMCRLGGAVEGPVLGADGTGRQPGRRGRVPANPTSPVVTAGCQWGCRMSSVMISMPSA